MSTAQTVHPQYGPLRGVVRYLQCPTCKAALRVDAHRLLCAVGHSFDIARQGYANLTVGNAAPGTADTSEMVIARELFLGGGHYRPIADLVAAQAVRASSGEAEESDTGLVVDLAGGTGYYLTAVLDRLTRAMGLCVDVSAAALRRAARAHPRAAAVGADVWQPLPIRTAAASVIINVFGPRNATEIERILTNTGQLIVVSPTPEHLHELLEPLDTLSVDPDKSARQAATFARLHQIASERLTYPLRLDHPSVAAIVGMGPTASHAAPAELQEKIAALPELTSVTVAVRVDSYTRG
ncbi:putative RNA methyltransferase [Jatrophihabitans sp. DSM 45814]